MPAWLFLHKPSSYTYTPLSSSDNDKPVPSHTSKHFVQRDAYAVVSHIFEPWEFIGKEVGYIPDECPDKIWIALVHEVDNDVAELKLQVPYRYRNRGPLANGIFYPSPLDGQPTPLFSREAYFERRVRQLQRCNILCFPPKSSSTLNMADLLKTSDDANEPLITFYDALAQD
jgi:hypothetical protein